MLNGLNKLCPLFMLQASSCSRDYQCQSFERSECVGTYLFNICFGSTRAYTVAGRCVNKSNGYCDLDSEYKVLS